MDDWMLVDVIHGSHDAILELLFGPDADMAQDAYCKSCLRVEPFAARLTSGAAMLTSATSTPTACKLFRQMN
jgi:hypothetical protein